MKADATLDRLRAADPQDPPSNTTELVAMVTEQLQGADLGPTPAAARRRRRRVLALATALLTLTAGTAIATGVPDEIIDMMSRRPTGDEAARVCEVDDPQQYATMVASAPWQPNESFAEGRVELWVAPTTTNNLYTALRFVWADGQLHGMNGGCGLNDPHVWTSTAGEFPVDDPDAGHAVVYGRTDLATSRVRIGFSTGATATADANDQGYYLEVVLGDPRPYTEADGIPLVTPTE